MSIIDQIRAHIGKPKNPIKEKSKRPPIDIARKLRQNATGLEAHYGETQFIERIRAAANIIETMETALQAIYITSTDKGSKAQAEEALSLCDKMRK